MTTNPTKTISQFIENQFPAIYREEGEELVAFLTAYYEYLEENNINREMFTLRDIDNTFEEFVVEFRKKYIDGFPFITSTDDRFLIKNIIDYYRSKGSEQSLKLLMRLIFGEDVSVYYPRQDILRVSDSRWVLPEFIELSFSPRSLDFVGKIISGSNSGAEAFVENVIRKRVNGKLIDLLYVSNVFGQFETGDYITDDGNLFQAPVMIGSLTEITDIESIEDGYNVGDRLRVISPNGVDANARVKRVFSQSDRVDILLDDPGFGYTLDDRTEVLISSQVLFCNNVGIDFEDLEEVKQTIEKVILTNPINGNPGDIVVGMDDQNEEVAEGVILTNEDGEVSIETTSGTFRIETEITLDSSDNFVIGERVEQERELELFTEDSQDFAVGEVVLQRDIVNGVSQNIAFGVVASVEITSLIVESSYGEFVTGKSLEGRTSEAVTTIGTVDYTDSLVFGNVLSQNGNVIRISTEGGNFDPGKKIRGGTSRVESEIQTVSLAGLNTIESDGQTEIVEEYENISAIGRVMGQRSTNIGVTSNTHPFIFIEEHDNKIVSESGVEKNINRIARGQGASFEIGGLKDEEQIETGVERIGDENVYDVPFLSIGLDGSNSSVNRISSINVINGGTGYSNTSIVEFSGGNPIIEAAATVETNGTGEIVSINLIGNGEGYLATPSISVNDGTGAEFEIEMENGYGFVSEPYSNLSTTINDALESETFTIGAIDSLSNITRGNSYDAPPFFRVLNQTIANSNVRDLEITFQLPTVGGTFALDERIVAENGAVGKIQSITTDRITVRKLTFTPRFQIGDEIVGQFSNSTTQILNIRYLSTENGIMGDNAVVSANVILANGLIAEVDILSTGYGYVEGDSLELIYNDNELAARGVANLKNQGKELGYWETTTSHLNDKYLQDSYFYQEFSYQIVAAISFDKYESIVRELLHVAGTELFGEVLVASSVKQNIQPKSSLSIGAPLFTSVENIADPNVVNQPYENINVDATNSGVGRIQVQPNLNIIDGGTGYSNNSIVEFVGGGENNNDPIEKAEASVTTDNNGTITSMEITNQGYGYWSTPDINITDGSGANIEIFLEVGYGFPNNPFGDENTNIEELFSEGQILFTNEQVIF